MESDQAIAKKANDQFSSEDYESCLKTLHTLSESRPKDTRIQLNKLVAEFRQSGCCKTDELRKGLSHLKKQYEQSDRHSGEELDDIALSCLLYNEAVVHFHLHQPNAAISLLERLFRIIEPLDDALAIKVSFLLVELYLVTYEVDQANGMINFIKTTLIGSKGNANEMEDFKIRLQKFKARALLLKSSLKECKRELKNIMNTDSSAAEALFLKSNYEFCRQNYPKSIRLLETAFKSPQQHISIPTMFHNDMSCVYFHMSKFNLALIHSRKALEENNYAMKSLPPFEKAHQLSGRPIHTLGMNRRHEILYNAGIQLLFAGSGLQAFDCLMEAHKTFYCSPRYWLRLAECCISVHQDNIKKQLAASETKGPLIKDVLKHGNCCKIILPSSADKYSTERLQSNHSSAMPSATLEFATICLQNVALLLPNVISTDESKSEEKQSEGEQESTNKTKTSAIGIEQPLEESAIISLRISLLSCQAYVSLEVSDYYNALNYGRQLLRLPNLPGMYKFLGQLYVAESYIHLNKITEAIQELLHQIVSDFDDSNDSQAGTITPVSSDELFPKTLHEAKIVMLLNLASAHCFQSDYEKARWTLQQVPQSKRTKATSKKLLLLSIYVDLQTGNYENALSIIKRGSLLSANDILEKFDNDANIKYPDSVYTTIETQSS